MVVASNGNVGIGTTNQVLGGGLITVSVPSIGLGVSQIVTGFNDNGSAGNIPGGIGEVSGMAVDKIVGNDPKKPIGRITGSWVDFGMGLALGKTPPTLKDAPSTAITIAYGLNDMENASTGESDGIIKKISGSNSEANTAGANNGNAKKEGGKEAKNQSPLPLVTPSQNTIKKVDFLAPLYGR